MTDTLEGGYLGEMFGMPRANRYLIGLVGDLAWWRFGAAEIEVEVCGMAGWQAGSQAGRQGGR